MAAEGRFPSRAVLGRAVNEALGIDLTPAAWRGLWIRNPEARERVDLLLGRAVLIRHDAAQLTATLSGNLRGSVTSDEHAPFHDPKAIALACEVLRWWKPDVHIFNGDQVDFYSVSRFEKNPARQFGLQEEIDQTVEEVFAPVRRAIPKARIIKIDGNHETRLDRYLHSHPEMFGLRVLRMENLFGLDKLSIDYAPQRVRCDSLLDISHGTRVNKWAGYAARAEVELRRYAINTITGHVHRSGRFETRVMDRHVIGQENPCLCSLNPEYMVDPDWAQGLTLFEVRDGAVWIETVTFTADYRVCAAGKWFGGVG